MADEQPVFGIPSLVGRTAFSIKLFVETGLPAPDMAFESRPLTKKISSALTDAGFGWVLGTQGERQHMQPAKAPRKVDCSQPGPGGGVAFLVRLGVGRVPLSIVAVEPPNQFERDARRLRIFALRLASLRRACAVCRARHTA